MRHMLIGVAAVLACAVVTPAAAATISLDSTGNWNGQGGYFTFDRTFVLPTNAINVVLSITNFGVDDRGILQLNGTAVDATGIFASNGSVGSFNFGQNAPLVAYTFDAPGARNKTISSGFVLGSNTFTFIGNDTRNGIFGNVIPTAEQTGYTIAASVTYDLANAGVPEPAAWAMMIGGFGAVGGALRRRRKQAVRVRFA